jgi:sporulation protein YlmC with PRC-barrel domain
MIAAMMTAANLGARVTGWGFVVFCVGSVAWLVVALGTGQQNLLLTNAFLLVVNIVGVWRWLGRQARYEDGGRAAARRSARAPVPSLFSAAGLAGLPVTGADGEKLGAVVDAMLRCGRNDIAYVVVSDGGSAGLGETLRALAPALLTIGEEDVRVDLDRAAFERLPAIAPDRWPEKLPA